MDKFTIHKGSSSSGVIFKPHYNKRSIAYLTKFKPLNTYQDTIIEQRSINNLFGLTYGFTSIGYGFNLKGDYLYLYGYYKNGKKSKVEKITRCLIDSLYYMSLDITKEGIDFSVHTFKRKLKDKITINVNTSNLFPLGLHTYPALGDGIKAPVALNIFLTEWNKNSIQSLFPSS